MSESVNTTGARSVNTEFQNGSLFRLSRRLLLLAIPAVMLLSGCGKSEPKREAVSPVTGKVSFNGQPPVGAQLVLHSVTPVAGRTLVPVALVNPDGTFKVTSYDAGDGAPPGDYVATITWLKVTDEGGRGPNVLPKDYEKKETSPIKFKVVDGNNEIPAIEITGK
ncbi:MAG TPA: hypothetical protein VL096_10860 [Pirellulaceae bacterium]|nr:hypothetical protein [Pirellulaceae bacterium]